MARGFESKSVQDAQEAEAQYEDKRKKRVEPDEMERIKQREHLMLSRTRVTREIGETSSDTRRESLRAALSHLDTELSKL